MQILLTAVTVLLFAFLVVQGLRRAEWAVLLALVFLPLEQLLASYIGVFARNTYLVNVVVGSVVLFSVAREFVMGRRPFHGLGNSVSIGVLFLYLFTILGVAWSPLPAAGNYFIRAGFPYYIMLLALLPALTTVETMRRMLVPFIVVGGLIIALIVVSPRTVIYGLRMFVDLSYATGVADSHGNPLVVAELGGAMVIVSALIGGGSGRRRGLLLIRVVTALAGIAITILSGTRGQMVFAIVIAASLYPLAHQVRNMSQFFLKVGVAGLLFVCFVAFVSVVSSRSASAERLSAQEIQSGLGARMYFAQTILDEYLSRPAFALHGLGTGAFNAFVSHDAKGYSYPHNLFVEILTEHGLIGFSLLLFVLAASGLAAKRLLATASVDPGHRTVVVVTVAMCGYVSMISMKQGSYAIMPLPFYWYMIMAKMERRWRLDGGGASWDEYSEVQHDEEDDTFAREFEHV